MFPPFCISTSTYICKESKIFSRTSQLQSNLVSPCQATSDCLGKCNPITIEPQSNRLTSSKFLYRCILIPYNRVSGAGVDETFQAHLPIAISVKLLNFENLSLEFHFQFIWRLSDSHTLKTVSTFLTTWKCQIGFRFKL